MEINIGHWYVCLMSTADVLLVYDRVHAWNIVWISMMVLDWRTMSIVYRWYRDDRMIEGTFSVDAFGIHNNPDEQSAKKRRKACVKAKGFGGGERTKMITLKWFNWGERRLEVVRLRNWWLDVRRNELRVRVWKQIRANSRRNFRLKHVKIKKFT